MAKKETPAPPDYGPIADASQASAELSYKLGQEQLEWARTTYANDKQITDKVVDSFLESMDFNQANAEEDRARYEATYQPLEDSLAADAASYSSPERQEVEAGRAMSGVAQQFEAARQSAQRELESFGINPSATRYGALDLGVRTAEAAAKAAAGNEARRRTEDTGRALRSEAINVGRGYPGQVAGQFAQAGGAGQGASGSQLSQTASGAATMGTTPQYLGLGNQAIDVWGNTQHMGYQDQLAGWQAGQQSSGVGAALGLLGGMAGQAFLGPVKPWVFEEGGTVPDVLSPSGGAIPDDVPAQLSAGEFVVPQDVLAWKGEEFFQRLIEKSREGKGEPEAIPTQSRDAPIPKRTDAPPFRNARMRQGEALPLRVTMN